MRVAGHDTRSIRMEPGPDGVSRPVVIDQTRLPHELHMVAIETVQAGTSTVSSSEASKPSAEKAPLL